MFCVSEKTFGDELREFRRRLRYTQNDFAEILGLERSTYKNYEYNHSMPGDRTLRKLRELGLGADVGLPTAPAAAGQVSIPYIGAIAAGAMANWTDPLDSVDWEFVPSEMVEGKARFSARIESDSMMPLLFPGDLCVFQASPVPRIGLITLHRSNDMRLTVKVLRHDGERFILHPLNPRFEDCLADGIPLGYLVGVVRELGRRRITDYDPDGIRP